MHKMFMYFYYFSLVHHNVPEDFHSGISHPEEITPHKERNGNTTAK